MERLAILFLVLVPLFARGRKGGWVIVADTVSLFRYGVFFWQKCVVMVEVQRFLKYYIHGKLWVKYSVIGRAILCNEI